MRVCARHSEMNDTEDPESRNARAFIDKLLEEMSLTWQIMSNEHWFKL